MSVYIPDEKGELSALDGSAISQQITQMPGDLGAAFAKMLITLVVLVILLFVTYWFLRQFIQKRMQKTSGNSSIQVLEKRMLSPKTMLYLVEVDQKKVLIAESHLEIKRLVDVDEMPNQ
ncbi:MAG: flagellar biosynthetic protein FliO [Verrucomicrobia bacterium]|nr:flagellar biosynthetic protein FliO [Verrucomicrobiota bacterium]MBU6446521.1 flagellar biosynthetic protein FliO [Verrucomicrobiota bacterium]MDE3047340.1 flagellar biosynthetic protein FliO [Verrucomicrobiota bacterium]